MYPNYSAARVKPSALATSRNEVKCGSSILPASSRSIKDGGFFVGDCYTIADIALYAYTHVAYEGGFDLEGFPAVRAWLGRVAAQPGHVPITRG